MTRAPRTLVTHAHAKVNLDLRVLGTRADGFHELRTVFQAIELHDTLTWRERPGPFTVKCRMPGVPLDDTNLVWRAAAATVEGAWVAPGRTARRRRRRIEKRIPMQAGLGGGSADAAAALLALARLWGGAPITLLREVGDRDRRRRGVLSVGRHRARTRSRRGDLSARRSAAALDRHRPSSVRRFDRRSVCVVRRRPGGGAERNARAADCCQCRGRPGRRR